MTARSRVGRYTYYVGEAFDADAPVSTGLTHLTQNNLFHLHDMASQHRINWFAAGDVGPYSAQASATDEWHFIARWSMPWSFTVDGWPRQPVLRVTGYGSGTDDLTVRAKISPVNETASRSATGSPIFGGDSDTLLTVDSTATSSTTPATLIDYPAAMGSPTWQGDKQRMRARIQSDGLRRYITYNNPVDGANVGIVVPMLALELYAQYASTAEIQSAFITSVYCREFAE